MELLKRPDVLHGVDPTVFERFVGSVLSSLIDVEVHHIGRSHVGGIDFIYSEGKRDFGVQVKRRTKESATEGVALVREFLGALLLEGLSGGSIVTTARQFSTSATEAAESAESEDLVSKLELIDKCEFLRRFATHIAESDRPDSDGATAARTGRGRLGSPRPVSGWRGGTQRRQSLVRADASPPVPAQWP